MSTSGCVSFAIVAIGLFVSIQATPKWTDCYKVLGLSHKEIADAGILEGDKIIRGEYIKLAQRYQVKKSDTAQQQQEKDRMQKQIDFAIDTIRRPAMQESYASDPQCSSPDAVDHTVATSKRNKFWQSRALVNCHESVTVESLVQSDGSALTCTRQNNLHHTAIKGYCKFVPWEKFQAAISPARLASGCPKYISLSIPSENVEKVTLGGLDLCQYTKVCKPEIQQCPAKGKKLSNAFIKNRPFKCSKQTKGQDLEWPCDCPYCATKKDCPKYVSKETKQAVDAEWDFVNKRCWYRKKCSAQISNAQPVHTQTASSTGWIVVLIALCLLTLVFGGGCMALIGCLAGVMVGNVVLVSKAPASLKDRANSTDIRSASLACAAV